MMPIVSFPFASERTKLSLKFAAIIGYPFKKLERSSSFGQIEQRISHLDSHSMLNSPSLPYAFLARWNSNSGFRRNPIQWLWLLQKLSLRESWLLFVPEEYNQEVQKTVLWKMKLHLSTIVYTGIIRGDRIILYVVQQWNRYDAK